MLRKEVNPRFGASRQDEATTGLSFAGQAAAVSASANAGSFRPGPGPVGEQTLDEIRAVYAAAALEHVCGIGERGDVA